ncbi:MAG: Lon protease family protein [Desulfonatronovibrionaceae bacterium]
MKKAKPLAPSRLRAKLPQSALPPRRSKEINAPGLQDRALKALELSLHVRSPGYNVYIAGEQGTGRTYFSREFLRPRAEEMSAPPDLVYVNNFEDPDRPQCLTLPPGLGNMLKKSLHICVRSIREAIPEAFAQESYVQRKESLAKDFSSVRDNLLQTMEQKANTNSFSLHSDENGELTLYPLIEGKVISGEEFERLDPELKKRFKDKSSRIMHALLGLSRKLGLAEQGLKEEEHKLDRQVAGEQIDRFLQEIPAEIRAHKKVHSFLQSMKEDMLENLDRFRNREETAEQSADLSSMTGGAAFFTRYQVNLFVDNCSQNGAPIVIDDHPGYFNLLGCMERESELGTYYTDFTLLKAGSLHRANNGFLILRAEDILANPAAWEGLLRALRSGYIRLEDPADNFDPVRTKTLEPEAVPLDVKIILIGTDELYGLLLEADDRFSKFFKLKAHMQEEAPRTAENIAAVVYALRSMASGISRRPLTRDAECALVDYSSEMVQDQQKLSLKLSAIKDILVEADAAGSMTGKKFIDAEAVEFARTSRIHRLNLYEQLFQEEYDREVIKVKTSGEASGCVNGLAVSLAGEYVLALPHQITCSVGVGHGGIIDLEREADLGGPIHTKAMLILKNYLQNLFAQDKPLVLSGSICFEQSYTPVDGDSASAGELIALISALSGVPVRFSLAITGAVGHCGTIMAVGEVTRKIEGFFEICRRKGLNGKHGVIIPADNVDNLMLEKEVIAAVRKGLFSIYPVSHVDQALELLTGEKAGSRLARGGFSPGSVYARVNSRLQEFAWLAERKVRRGRKTRTT